MKKILFIILSLFIFSCDSDDDSSSSSSSEIEGCIDVGFYFNSDDENDLVVFESWESRAHYEKYFAWRTETGALGAIASYLDDEPSIRYLTKSDI